ncbi:IclR family transcriptional regulator [Bradyrhizobium sp. CCGUVB23]|nr:IclR family transcriptional regulator [Bradyrhizobium sp. CCGUVB23]MCP3463533.1 IclR family transcriptional regulator [Bradyrhizobium sp. CCGUVB23]
MLTDSLEGPLGRALAVIEFIASRHRAVTIAEVADALDLPIATTHRITSNLERQGLLQRSLTSKRLLIGNKMLLLGASAVGAGLRTATRHAILQRVSEKIGEQCEIGVVRDNLVSYVDSVRKKPSTGLQFDPGASVPIHCTSTGKIYLSQLARRARETLIRSLTLHAYTERTITDPDDLLEIVERTRERGWAKSNEEFVKGVVGCAVPIFGPDQMLLACVGISAPVARITFEDLDDIISILKDASSELSAAIIDDELSEDV